MTWREVKLITLQKMYAAQGDEIITDESTGQYLASMPYAANEGMLQIITAGKGIDKVLEISHNPIPNLLPHDARMQQHLDTPIEYAADSGLSYYFEVTGPAEVSIQVGEDTPLAIETPATPTSAFVAYRGLIDNAGKEKVKLTFAGEYPFIVRNVALYAYAFPTDTAVPPYTAEIRYNMSALAEDFYKLKADDVIFEGANWQSKTMYRWEGENTLVLPRDNVGSYSVHYFAYPMIFTSTTPDDIVVPMPPDALSLLPLYMASQLYKDDDLSLATIYRNEFEAGIERLSGNTGLVGRERFVSESGWV